MDEFKKLEADYCDGKFKVLEIQLDKFIRDHKEDIKEIKKKEAEHLKGIEMTDELAIKMFIMKARSISTMDEIRLELSEIEREIWFQTEKTHGPVDRNKVAMEWCKLHAPGWRDNWILGALFVFERNKDKLIAILHE